MQEDKIDVSLTKRVTRCHGLVRIVHHAKIDDFNPECSEASGDLLVIAFQSLVQPRELLPVGIQANAEEANLMCLIYLQKRAQAYISTDVFHPIQ